MSNARENVNLLTSTDWDIAALRLANWGAGAVPAQVVLKTNYVAGDGGGLFRFDALDTTSPDNTGTVIVDAAGNRWKRQFSGPVNLKWFGARGDGLTNDTTAVQTAINVTLFWDIGAGATQTGNFNAAVGLLYPVNTTGGAVTATLPANPNVGDRIGFRDANDTWDTNNLTINGNGRNIEGSASNKVLSTEGQYYVLEYSSTQGWFLAQNGGSLFVPNGNYRLASQVNIDLTYLSNDREPGRIRIYGEGAGSTQFLSAHAANLFSFTGDAINGLFGYFSLEDMTLRGSGIANSIGLFMDNIAAWTINRCRIIDFDYGIYATDALTGSINDSQIRFNYKNYRFQFSNVSRPNAIAFSNTVTAAGYDYGGWFDGASSISYDSSCTLEGNGITPSNTINAAGFGLKFVNCAVEGKTGLQFFGNYVEFNAGIADFIFEQTSGQSTHVINGMSCARISSTLYTTQNILVTVSGGGLCKVTCRDSAFGGLNTYVEDVSRPYVTAPAGTFFSYNNKWQSAVAQTVVNLDQAGFYARKRGLILSNNGSDPTNDIDISAGGWLDGTFADVMILPSAITKRLDAAWAVGTNQGGLDTGSIANTTYHVWLIKRFDTGVTDVLFSTSATAPTMPTNYDYKVRIGSIIRSSGAILGFTQVADTFKLKEPGLSFTADNGDLTTARVTKTLAGIPTGVVVEALLTPKFTDLTPTIDRVLRIQALTETDVAVTVSNGTHQTVPTDGTLDEVVYQQMVVPTNTSAQIGARTGSSDADVYLGCITRGWRETWRDAS